VNRQSIAKPHVLSASPCVALDEHRLSIDRTAALASLLEEFERYWLGLRPADAAVYDFVDDETLEAPVRLERLQHERHHPRVLLADGSAAEAARPVGRQVADPAVHGCGGAWSRCTSSHWAALPVPSLAWMSPSRRRATCSNVSSYCR